MVIVVLLLLRMIEYRLLFDLASFFVSDLVTEVVAAVEQKMKYLLMKYLLLMKMDGAIVYYLVDILMLSSSIEQGMHLVAMISI